MYKYNASHKTYFGRLQLSGRFAVLFVCFLVLSTSSIAYALVEVTQNTAKDKQSIATVDGQPEATNEASLAGEPANNEDAPDEENLEALSETSQPEAQTRSQSVNDQGLEHDLSQPVIFSGNRSNQLAKRPLYVSSHDPAGWTASEWAAIMPHEASMLRKISGQPIGVWLVRGLNNISGYVGNIVNDAKAKNQTPVFVLYGMPAINCSNFAQSSEEYLSWVNSIKQAVGTKPAVFIIEPDELPLAQCGGGYENERLALVARVVKSLQSGAETSVYIDAGHGNWVDAGTMAVRLKQAGIEYAQGFSLNVSNYETTEDNIRYANQLSPLVGNAHYVIDTSRNGLGPSNDREWCNAPGRALGERPRAMSAGILDAYLWIKYPGESDLACNGGPAEGQWWPEYAVGLAERSSY